MDLLKENSRLRTDGAIGEWMGQDENCKHLGDGKINCTSEID